METRQRNMLQTTIIGYESSANQVDECIFMVAQLSAHKCLHPDLIESSDSALRVCASHWADDSSENISSVKNWASEKTSVGCESDAPAEEIYPVSSKNKL